MKNQKQTKSLCCAQIILFLHIFFASIMILNAQNPVGAIPGEIDISPMGAATYTIPIEVVPGTQGMQPNLSIAYNSMGGMGLLGMKWTLSGLSAITRCGQNPYYNDNLSSISYRGKQFAIDGSKLIQLNNISWIEGAEWATEMENFTRIISNGGAIPFNPPTNFTAYTDDGSIIEYGNSADSKQILNTVASPMPILSWYINKITDANGNYMTYHYGHAPNSNNELWIDSIKYTGNATAGIAPYAKVVFSYTDLPATLGKNTCFVSGYGIPQTKLLQTIIVTYGNDLVRMYMFNYNNDSGERTAHLKNILLYEGGGTNATTITWGTQNNAIEVSPMANLHTEDIITGDFNGDGFTDYVVYNIDAGTTKTWKLYFQDPTNNTFNFYTSGQSREARAYSHDYNGDGKDEMILVEDCKTENKLFEVSVYECKSNGFIKTRIWQGNYFEQVYFGDFSGNGKVNVMYVTKQKVGTKYKYTLSFSNNDFSCSDLQLEDINIITIIDYNGNRKANIQITKGNDTDIYEYSSDNQRFNLVVSGNLPTRFNCHYGDFNGDGITDILMCFPDSVFYAGQQCCCVATRGVVCFGKGNGYYEFSTNILHFSQNMLMFIEDCLTITYSLFIADINGDGKDDIIQAVSVQNEKTTFHIYYSEGFVNGNYQFTKKEKVIDGNYIQGNHKWWHLGDFNGDGKNDILFRNPSTDTHHKIVYFNKNEQYEFVKEIADGIGKIVQLNYKHKYYIAESVYWNPTYPNRKKKYFLSVTESIKVSNGIGNGLNTFEYQYNNAVYSLPRKTFFGFKNFVCINNQENKKDEFEFVVSDAKQIILPARQMRYYGSTKTTDKFYTFYGQSMPHNRYIFYRSIKEFDILSQTAIQESNGLNMDGRLTESTIATYEHDATGGNFNLPLNGWMHREKKYYTYNPITLNGKQTKTVPTQIITTQQFGSNGLIIADTITYNYSTSGINKGRLNWMRQGNTDGSITTTYSNYTGAGLCREKTVSATGINPSRKEYYEYDNTHRFVTKIKNHLLHETQLFYDAKTGNTIKEIDPNGLTTIYSYDNFGRIKQINYPDGTVTKNTINWFTGSNPPNARYYTKTTATEKADLVVYYDILGREVCRQEDGYYYDTRYNAKGQVTRTSYPYSYGENDTQKEWHRYFYDDFGRVNYEIAPYVYRTYAYNNRKVTVTDHNIQTYKDYDALGRITEAGDLGGTITYNYTVINDNNKKRHKTTITTNNAPTTIISDLWGNRLSITDPDAGTITSEYNKLNELTKQTDAKGNITTYQYDALGRITQKQITGSGANPLTVQYTYDNYTTNSRGRGKLWKIKKDNIVEEEFTYNNLSRLWQYEKVIDNTPYSFYYTYTPAGQLQKMVYPDNFAVTYSYSSTGKLTEIRNAEDNSLIYKVTNRNKYQQPTQCIYGKNPIRQVVTDYTYNDYGLIIGINTYDGMRAVPYDPGTVIIEEEMPKNKNVDILNYKYAYNNKGLMISRSDNTINQAETYTYDNLDRLTQIQYAPGVTQTMTYANNGNITNNSYVGSYTYNNSKPHAVAKITPINNDVISANNCAVTYNSFNQPTEITEGNYKLNLFYDANQQRNKMEVSDYGNNIHYYRYYINKYYEVEQRFGHLKVDINHYYHYIYGDNDIVALHVSNMNPIYSEGDSMYYIHTDHLGSYCAITNEKGKEVMRNHFDPWGNYIVRNFPPPDIFGFTLPNRGFTGHEHYPKLKIINMNGRLYDPVIARFFSPDNYVQSPDFTQSYNRYSYARNCPLMFKDPNGQWEYNWYVETNNWGIVGPFGGEQTQYVNLINGFGANIGTYTFPGSDNYLTRSWGMDAFGNIHFSIYGSDLGTGAFSSSASLSGVYHPAYYYGDDIFISSHYDINYTDVTHIDYSKFSAPSNDRIEYSPFNVEDIIMIGQMVKGLCNVIESSFLEMFTSTQKSAQILIDENMALLREAMQAGKVEGTNFVEQVVVHGNSLKSTRPTWGYKLYSNEGTFLKNGITSKIVPETRYTKSFMLDKNMNERFLFPNRLDAWNWELQQNLILRGPLNKNLH